MGKRGPSKGTVYQGTLKAQLAKMIQVFEEAKSLKIPLSDVTGDEATGGEKGPPAEQKEKLVDLDKKKQSAGEKKLVDLGKKKKSAGSSSGPSTDNSNSPKKAKLVVSGAVAKARAKATPSAKSVASMKNSRSMKTARAPSAVASMQNSRSMKTAKAPSTQAAPSMKKKN